MSTDPLQKLVFSNGEANAWFHRNRHSLGSKHSDPLLLVLSENSMAPKNVLEIGCSDGWRLRELREMWPNCNFFGLDPSREAVESGNSLEGLHLSVGTADNLSFQDKQFDLVIFGFCLYLVDRCDLFRVVAEADRVLQDGGRLAIFDFYVESAYARPYSHSAGVKSYKMDYSKLWLGNPSYRMERKAFFDHSSASIRELRETEAANPDDVVTVHLLRKGLDAGWPLKK